VTGLKADHDYTVQVYGKYGPREWMMVLLCQTLLTTSHSISLADGIRRRRNLVANPGFEHSAETTKFVATQFERYPGMARHWTPFYTGGYLAVCDAIELGWHGGRSQMAYPRSGRCVMVLGLARTKSIWAPKVENFYGAHQSLAVPPYLESSAFLIRFWYMVSDMTRVKSSKFAIHLSWQGVDRRSGDDIAVPLDVDVERQWRPFCLALCGQNSSIRMLHLYFHLHQRKGWALIDDVSVIPVSATDHVSEECISLPDPRRTFHPKPVPHVIGRLESIVRPKLHQLTLAIPLTSDRILRLLAVAKAYGGGPVAALVLVRDGDDMEVFQSIWKRQPWLRHHVDVEFLFDPSSIDSGLLPINLMRNAAVRMVLTEFVLMLDVDLMPGTDSFSCFRDINGTVLRHLLPPGRKEALVVPVFLTDTVFRPPLSKSELQNALHHRVSLPYCLNSQRGTRFDKWYGAVRPFETKFETDYEPYCIVRRDMYPEYDERFVGYGFNKVAWTVSVQAAGFRLVVLPFPFLVHLNHLENRWVQDIVTEHYLKTWRRFFAFTAEVLSEGELRPYQPNFVPPSTLRDDLA